MAELYKKRESKKQGLFDPGNLLILMYITVIIVFSLMAGLLGAHAAETVEDSVGMEDVRQGQLLLVREGNRLQPAPVLSQKVRMAVSGIAAKVIVEQRFANTGPSWLEAVYVFPLPDESSVDHLTLCVGERRLDGEIMEKAVARKTHEKAKREGRKSSLLVQNRPNIFTSRVANIGPGEEVTVVIEYQQTVHFADNIFSLRFPMVVGPRYIPGKPIVDGDASQVTVSPTGWAVNTDQVPDASEITPSVDVLSQTNNMVDMTIDLAAGMSLSRLESLYHGIESNEFEENHYAITLTGEVMADRDFVLEWQPENAEHIKAALFAERMAKDQYMLLMLMPPQRLTGKPVPREVVFILDISGSMAGASIIQAKAAVSIALQRLRPRDRFNVVAFNNKSSTLYGQSQPADQAHLEEALRYVNSLNAEGGTEMQPALLLALDGSSHDDERLRQVIFLTDGAVGNESALLEFITKRLGDSRLFTVGIGSAPNSYFMSRAASMGRGTFTYIGKDAEVKTKMVSLFKKLENPVLSDLQLDLAASESDIEMYPSPLPDLYAGEPLLLAIRTGWGNKKIQIKGTRSGQPWQTSVDTSIYGRREGIGALWARKKIRSQIESLALGADKKKVREAVVKTALEHHLVSKYTSLVVVDTKVSRPQGEKNVQAAVKNHLPHGWQANAVFAGGAQTATSADLRLVIGTFCILVSLLIMLYRRVRCPER